MITDIDESLTADAVVKFFNTGDTGGLFSRIDTNWRVADPVEAETTETDGWFDADGGGCAFTGVFARCCGRERKVGLGRVTLYTIIDLIIAFQYTTMIIKD